MVEIIRQVVTLQREGYRMVMVSSGAIAAGREMLNYPALARSPARLSKCSAPSGQGYLMQVYSMLFGLYDTHIGQVLLTHDDLSNRTRYLNARDTLNTLLDYGIVPIVNENDTVAVEEIKVGDNDNLSAQIAVLLNAPWLVILTDQDGLYDRDPRQQSGGAVDRASRSHRRADQNAGRGERFGIGRGRHDHQNSGGAVGNAQRDARRDRQWAHAGRADPAPERRVARDHLCTLGRSHRKPEALAAGGACRRAFCRSIRGRCAFCTSKARVCCRWAMRSIRQEFERGAVVLVVDEQQKPVAQGLVNYTSAELTRLRGHQSREIVEILGYTYGDEAIHRDNMVLM